MNETSGTERPVEVLVEGVHVSFGRNHVLRGVDLAIRRGEMVALVGGSGCGKTVLLQCILGHLVPDRGSVRIADHEQDGAPLVPIAHLPEKQMDHIRHHWAVVFQRNALFSGSVYDNLALWLREIRGMEREEIVPLARQALRDVGLPDDDALLAKQRDELSGGMQKRLAVARAIITNPVLMFYDEPTTGLDPNLAAQVHELIRTTHESRWEGELRRTTVIITHDKDLLYRLEPRIVMLHEGVVHFDGTHAEFEQSDSDPIQPYFDLMPELHRRPVV